MVRVQLFRVMLVCSLHFKIEQNSEEHLLSNKVVILRNILFVDFLLVFCVKYWVEDKSLSWNYIKNGITLYQSSHTCSFNLRNN